MLKLLIAFLAISMAFTATLRADYQWQDNYLDSSGNNRHGAAGSTKGHVNTQFVQGICQSEKALQFAENVLDAAILDPSAIQGVSSWTITFWIKSTQNLADSRTLISGIGGGDDNEMRINIRNKILRVGLKGSTNKLSVGEVADGQWHHVALTRSGTTLQGYIDGVLANSASSYTDGDLNINGFLLGDDQDCLWGCFDPDDEYVGLLGRLRIYSGVLTPAEVLAQYNEKSSVLSGQSQPDTWEWRVSGVNYSASQKASLKTWCERNCYVPGTTIVAHPACLNSSGVHQRCFLVENCV